MTKFHETLHSAAAGDEHAVEELFPLVYDQLRQVAAAYMRQEDVAHTLQPTALVHEVYIKLAGSTPVDVNDHVHFLAVAARAMRWVLVDHARSRGAAKRGGPERPLPLDDSLLGGSVEMRLDLLALDQALSRLQKEQPDKASIVEMRFFGGMKESEIAAVLGISKRTVVRHWKYAQAWLYKELDDSAA